MSKADRVLLGRLRIELLDRSKHDRSAFACGVVQVDTYLKTAAAGQQDVDATRVYVACSDDDPAILSFYSLNAHAIDIASLPDALRKKLPRYPTVGAIYLSVVGVDKRCQGAGIGSFLLADAMKRSARVADQIGAAFIVLDALNEKAAALYRRLGFEDLSAQRPRMIINMKRVRAAVAAADQPVKPPS